MALLLRLFFKCFYFGTTIVYPGYKTYVSVKEGKKIDKLWIDYFFIMGLLLILQNTMLYPLVLLCDLILDCLFPVIKIVFAAWMMHPEYRGALLIEELSMSYMEMAYNIVNPIIGKVLGIIGVPDRSTTPKDKTN